MSLDGCTQPILAKSENDLTLFEDGPFTQRSQGAFACVGNIAVDDVCGIVGHLRKGKGEKQLFGFKIAQLKDKVELHMGQPEVLEDRVFRPPECKVELALLCGEAGPPIEGVNFLLREDLEAF